MTAMMWAVAPPPYDDAMQMGRLIGTLLRDVLLVAGLIKCISIARRPTTSAKCVLALALVLGGWLVGSTSSWASPAPPPWNLVLASLIVLVTVLLCLGALTLASVGLVDLRRWPGVFKQGRAQAIWALVLAGITLVVMVGSLLGVVARQVADSFGQTSVAPGTRLTFTNHNCCFELPARPWTQIDTKFINADACLGLIRTHPQMHCFLIAEEGAAIRNLTLDSLAEISKANMRSVAVSMQLASETNRVVNGLSGRRFGSEVQIGQHKLFYVHWVFINHGFAYQLITAGNSPLRDQIEREADGLVARFRQLDPARQAGPAAPVFGAHTSAVFRYTLDLRQQPWRQWVDFHDENPNADCAGKYEDGSGRFLLYALDKAGSESDADSLTHAFLSRFVGDEPQDQYVMNLRESPAPGRPSRTFGYQRETAKQMHAYRVALWSAPHQAYYLVYWQPVAHQQDIEARFDELCNALHIDSGPNRAPLAAAQRKANAELINQLGLYYFRRDNFAAAEKNFRTAFRQQTNTTYAANFLHAAAKTAHNSDALAFLAALPAGLQQSPELLGWRAWHCQRLDRRDEALQLYRQLLAAGGGDLDDLGNYARLLAEGGQWTDFQRAFDDYARRDQSAKPLLLRVRLLNEFQKTAEALRLLQAARTAAGRLAPDLGFALINSHNQLEQYGESVAVADNLISNGFQTAAIYRERGVAEYNLGWYRRAKTTFEAAARLAPKDADLARLLQRVSGMLGEGDNSSVKEALPPVPLAAGLASNLPPFAVPTPPNGHGAVVLNDLRMFAYEPGRDLRSTRYLRVRMLDASGVSHYSTLYQDFDPLWEKVFVNQLVVRDAAGQVVLTGTPADYYVVNKSDTSQVSFKRTLCLPVPQLLPGHTVELVLTKSALGIPDEFDFARLWLVHGQPALLAGAGYGGALTNIRYAACNGVQTTASPSGCVWQVRQVPAFEPEALEPGRDTFMPLLLLADGAAGWQRAADAYLGRLAGPLRPERPVQALAQRLTAGATNTAQRIRRICEYVQTNFTYRGIEFGVRGRVPPPSEETLRNRYGDCKEHAVLTVQLLRAAGVEAYPALVHTAWPIATNLPTLEQFNHMLAYVPDGRRFLDTTEKNCDITAGIPAGLGGRQALVLAPGAARFVAVAAYRPADCCVSNTATILLARNGTVRVRETTTVAGYYAAALRDWLRDESASAGQQWAQDSLRRHEPTAELTAFQAEPLNHPAATLTLTTAYTLPAAGGARLTPPAWWLKYYFQTSPAPHRQHPLGLEYPLHVVATARIQAEDTRLRPGVPAPAGHTGAALAWRVSAQRDGAALVLTADSRNIPGHYPPEEFERYRQSTDRLLRAATAEITFAPAP